MKDAAILLGADKSKAEEELKEVILFQIRLANASAPREERRNQTKLFNYFTLKDLDKNLIGRFLNTAILLHGICTLLFSQAIRRLGLTTSTKSFRLLMSLLMNKLLSEILCFSLMSPT